MLLFVPVRHLHPQPSHPRFSFAGPFKKKKPGNAPIFLLWITAVLSVLIHLAIKTLKKKDSSNPNIPFKFSFLVCNDCVIDYTYLRRWRRLPAGKQSAWSIKRLLWEFINTPNNHWFTSSACTECRCFQTSLMEPSAPAWHFSLFLQQSLRPPWLLHVIRHLYTDQQSCCLWLVLSPLRKSKLWKKGYLVTRFLCSLLAASEDHTVA